MTAERALDDHIDALFRGPAEDFVGERDALAKRLKADGDADGAATVKGLRKPTLAAWAVNQLAHRERQGISRLLDLGDELRAAHEALLEGQGDAGIRRATNDRRALVGELTDKAVALLGPSGEGQRDAIADTLDAAVADPDAGILVQRGRLSKELNAPSGFGGGDLAGVFASAPAPARATKAKAKSTAKPSKRPAKAGTKTSDSDDEDKKAEAERQRQDEQRREEHLARLRADLEARRAEADQAAKAADEAHDEVDRLQRQLDEAEQRARVADTAARRARKAADQAERELDRATR